MPTHFGVIVRNSKRGLKLTRENYAVVNNKNSLIVFKNITYADEAGKYYTDEWCAKHLDDCLKNYDLHMEYFSTLSREKFNNCITEFVKKYKEFKSITDLNTCDGKPGYYLMILDEYCQVYIGTTKDIKRRIRQHWSKNKPFDRVLFPMGAVYTSIMSIDSFRAYDTTRIYAYFTPHVFDLEDKYINHFPPEFVCNRMAGGRILGGGLQALAMRKQRRLSEDEE